MANKSNPHDGHRDRLREKLFNYEENMEDHEMLEVLLYSVYPRQNTNPIAHRLIDRFGSLYNVFAASEQELMSVDGIGKQAAAVIYEQGGLLRRYSVDKMNAPTNMTLTPKNAGRYIMSFFEGYSNEVLILFALDAECRIKKRVLVSKGSIDRVQAYMRDIVRIAIETQAKYVILAHNHPHGDVGASENDLIFTAELERALTYVNVRLIDHIIVAKNDYISIANQFNVFELM